MSETVPGKGSAGIQPGPPTWPIEVNGRKFILRLGIFAGLGPSIAALVAAPFFFAPDLLAGKVSDAIVAVPAYVGNAYLLGAVPSIVAALAMPSTGRSLLVRWQLVVTAVTIACSSLIVSSGAALAVAAVIGGQAAAWACRMVCIRLGIEDWAVAKREGEYRLDERALYLRLAVFVMVGTQLAAGFVTAVAFVFASLLHGWLFPNAGMIAPFMWLGLIFGFAPAAFAALSMPYEGGALPLKWLLKVAVFEAIFFCWLIWIIPPLGGLVLAGGVVAAIACRGICFGLGIPAWHVRGDDSPTSALQERTATGNPAS